MNYEERPAENKPHKFIHSGQGDYTVVYCQNCGIVAYDCGKWISESDQDKINEGCPLG